MDVKIIKCFIASPSDTAEERRICDEVLAEINHDFGDIYKIRLESIKWENQSYPDFGVDGQDVLNKQLQPGNHPFFIGIFKLKFGSVTARYPSGSQEEFEQAYKNWKEGQESNIQIYFDDQPPESLGAIDTGEIDKIRDFKKEIVKKGCLYHTYKGVSNFKKSLRDNITKSLASKFKNFTEPRNDNEDKHAHNLEQLENKLKYALKSYKGQPEVFVKPSLSNSQRIDDDDKILREIVETPYDTFIASPPLFGLTCLSLYMQIEAYKTQNLWIHLDAAHIKASTTLRTIEEQSHQYNKDTSEVKCFLIDSWNSGDTDHLKIVRHVDSAYPGVPVIIFTSDDSLVDPRAALGLRHRDFETLHLQALSRNKIRQLLDKCCPNANRDSSEKILTQITSHLESINIHRTPLNCLTLHRVSGSEYNEKLINKAKLMKAILFVLFTDRESFSYSDDRPDAEECTYVLGKFCKTLVEKSTLSFNSSKFREHLALTCSESLITLDIESMIDVLIDNNILIEQGEQFEFKHRFWIYYFAADWMTHDDDFRTYILNDRRYTNIPDLIEFYSGIDGKRADALETILEDLDTLTQRVDEKIGISGEFNPLSDFLWNPLESFIEKTKKEIAEKVESSNLPPEIKDRHADKNYDPDAPSNQSINNFLSDFSVHSLRGSIAAASRALRNSTFVSPDLKLRTAESLVKAWEEISKVAFWISPILAKDKKAYHDGLGFVLSGSFSEDLNERFEEILIAIPKNVVSLLKDDLSSKKIGAILYEVLEKSKSLLRKHLLVLFIIETRPEGWYDIILKHINRLHPSSFYLSDILSTLKREVKMGFINNDTELQLKRLTRAIVSKRQSASKAKLTMSEKIEPSAMYSEDNELHLDQLLAKNEISTPEKYGQSLKKRKRH